MTRRFQKFDTLRIFVEIARHPSLSAAANALNMTKGAISYQVKTLEDSLQVRLLDRSPRGFTLTKQGRSLIAVCATHFHTLENQIADLIEEDIQTLTIGLSTYFAARWLSPRLTDFMQRYPGVRLRLQPMTQLFDLEGQGIDIAIRWGNGQWSDAEVSPFLQVPAWPAGTPWAKQQVERRGVESAFSDFVLLRDHDDSDAWSNWKREAGLESIARRDALIIPDPNVRVQAVVNGQGVALMDDLAQPELGDGRLVRLSGTELPDYGYFIVVPFGGRHTRATRDFVEWLQGAAENG